ncbi:surface lipoprotein assembly modifier [Candidatus Ferrigenium straubiae]|mgnify:CR=1 FL=1|jgi:tetratricopeptide (TPR) repeat protein|uniref:surface lipoprotein assembly modifier n=1 Tax=Candidatus Ferrigenium straubiae TaxID=2919506 RepID=UPI003F4AAD03
MKLVQWVCCGVFGALMAAGTVAQAEPQGAPKKAVTKKAKPAAKKAAKPGARALQAQREAAARAKAEQEARQRAEAEARKQAEAEAKRAEIEAREKPIRDAEEMMKNGKPADAYALLEPLEFERSGEVRFDYLLGIAALDSGKPDKATLAFERVLAVDPNFAGARLDMARAYYQLGDLPRAQTEFQEVLKQNPPEAARITIQKYLDAIVAAEQAKQTRISGYVEGTVGHDSNIANSSTQTFTFAPTSPWIGFFPGNQLPPAAKLSGTYEGVNAGAEISHNLNGNWGVFAGADLRQHGNMTQTAYDTVSTDARLGAIYAEEQNAYKLTLTGGQYYTANSMRRDSVGLSAEWQHVFSPANQMSAFAQYGQNRAAGVQPTSPTTDARIEGDTNQAVVGAGWVHIMADGKQALFGSIYAGKELDVAPVISPGLPDGGRTDGKKRFEGLRIGGQATFYEQLDGIASLGWQSAHYGKLNNLIMANRSEQLYDLTVAANWRLDKLWSVRPQVIFSRKNSNISLYSFDRADVSLTIRRDFR